MRRRDEIRLDGLLILMKDLCCRSLRMLCIVVVFVN
jgi:hypothetical protein